MVPGLFLKTPPETDSLGLSPDLGDFVNQQSFTESLKRSHCSEDIHAHHESM